MLCVCFALRLLFIQAEHMCFPPHFHPRCTSVLSDDSELSTLCDEEPLGSAVGLVGYGHDDEEEEEETRPELLSSSEDSSPEADIPFSKKFLNVFVNGTSRSSSKSR